MKDRHNNKQTVIEEWNANQEWFMNIEDEDEEQEEDKKEEETIAPEITVQEYDYEYNEGMDDLDEKHGGDEEEVDEKTTKTTEEKDKELKEEQEYQKRITDIFGQEVDFKSLDRSIDEIESQFDVANLALWQKEYKETADIIEKVQDSKDNDPIRKLYKVEENVLYINNLYLQQKYGAKKKKLRKFTKKSQWSIGIPEVTLEGKDINIKWYLVRLYHGLPVSGHLGVTGTCTLIRKRFYWKNMKTDIKNWVAACHPCQRRKMGKQNSTGKRRTVLQKRPFETVSIDLVGPFPETPEGYVYVLTMVCHFTRYPIAVPIVSKEAKVVARALKRYLFTEYPFWPTKILSDRGTEFVNSIIDILYKQLGIKQKITTHDNAQANQVERFHRYMNAAIACFIQQKERQHLWEEYLDCAVYVYRCMTNSATGHSPFYALYGVEPVKPMDMI